MRRLLLIALMLLLLTTSACASSNRDGRIVRGNPSTVVTIVEYTDFQCPYCALGAKTVSAVMERYPGKVKLIVRHVPLPFHPMAMPAALYFEAIALQSPEKAWQYYDRLFAEPRRLGEGEECLKRVAMEQGLDMARLEKDVRSPAVYKKIAEDKKAFEDAGFDGVPAFVINGKVLVGAQPPARFHAIIDEILKK